MENKHEWQYYSLGGVTRVFIHSGEDIAHLDELDQKLWTVLSCPVEGLEMNPQTLKLIDSDNDGKIRVAEVIATAKRLCSVIKDKDLILKGDTVLPLDQINDEKLLNSAKQILKNLQAENQNEITLAQASDSKAIFAGSKFNGDGIITLLSTEDERLKECIRDILSTSAAQIDRSGENGVNEASVEHFYAECKAYSDWMAQGDSDKILPYADNTQAVLESINVLKEKIADFFTRCKLEQYDEKIAQSVGVSVSSIEDIQRCPIATPNKEGLLLFDAINPSWQAQVARLRALVPAFATLQSINEADWTAVCDSLLPYTAWMGNKAGCSIEALGIERIRTILKEDNKSALLSLIAEDKALESESNAIDEVKHLMLLYKDFFKFLKNYITFTDFYRREERALFEVGKLYVDQRCCDLCIKVSDMNKHADMAGLSGIFLIYCTCTSVKKAKSMNIVAIMTDGNTLDLRPGKNGIFYDCNGQDWDAVITKVVDNPISIKAAFWSPYRKFWDFCVGLINKSAEDKDKKITADLQAKVAGAAANPPTGKDASKETKMPFDIAKFAGIFAAIGLALGTIGSFITGIANGIKENPLSILYALVAIIVVISGPSCFIAWSKLRKRNLGPILNANGWAINSKVLINILFGSKLTSVAQYPKAIRLKDPYVKNCSAWKWILTILIFLALVCAVLYFTGVLQKLF